MKKVVPVILTVLMLFTSCEVHLNGQHWDVPWNVALIAIIPILVLSALLLVVAGVATSKTKYVCSKCNNTFYPKWYRSMFTGHVNDERALYCPHCKSVQRCSVSYNQDE